MRLIVRPLLSASFRISAAPLNEDIFGGLRLIFIYVRFELVLDFLAGSVIMCVEICMTGVMNYFIPITGIRIRANICGGHVVECSINGNVK